MEGSVTTNEFYYLLLVIGAFGAFATALSVATVRYKAWLRGAERRKPAPSSIAGRLVGDA
jgi:hypothetical protein